VKHSLPLSVTFAFALSLAARTAEAHLMSAQQGTINVVGTGIFVVLSVPASALPDADDDHDGLLAPSELERHAEALRAEIDRRLVLRDGESVARTVRVDLIASPEHGEAAGRADQIVVLKHAEVDAPPVDLRVRCDLFGAGVSAGQLTLRATRHAPSGAETQVASLTREASEHRFFLPGESGAAPATLAARGRSPGLLAGAGIVVALGLVVAGLGGRR